MYNMRAEHVVTENGIRLLWHVVDRNGNALCARIFRDKASSTPDGMCAREDYCRSCMSIVATTVLPSPVTTDSPTSVGEAAQQNADIVAPNPGGRP
ncbi:hypothetical protein [Streptomyces sp. NPDC057909]|uniref:hypothetical protein n=1 Tax=Streptomyces sp. NPDC057909 TaxID=3346277 RepID=UPI0036EE2E6B